MPKANENAVPPTRQSKQGLQIQVDNNVESYYNMPVQYQGIELITENNEPRIDHRLLAVGIGVDEKSLTKLILKHRKNIESFGPIKRFKIPKLKAGKGRSSLGFLLNEGQSCFLITLSRNTPQFVELKKRLVSAFLKLRKVLARQAKKEWITAREEGKSCRKQETDIIKRFIAYAKGQGSKNAQFYYCNLTKLGQKTLFGKLRSRDDLSAGEISLLAVTERMIDRVLTEYMNSEGHIHYKEIYKQVKTQLEAFVFTLPGNLLVNL